MPKIEAERRHLTLRFNPVVNSTALTSCLDPEQQRSIVQDDQRVCAESAEADRGRVAHALDDEKLRGSDDLHKTPCAAG